MKPRGGATCSRGSRWGSGGVLAFARFIFLFRAIVRSRCRRQSDDSSSGGAKMSNCEVVGIDGEGPSKHRERLFLPQAWLVLLSQSFFLASRRLLGLSCGVEYHRFSSQRITLEPRGVGLPRNHSTNPLRPTFCLCSTWAVKVSPPNPLAFFRLRWTRRSRPWMSGGWASPWGPRRATF